MDCEYCEVRTGAIVAGDCKALEAIAVVFPVLPAAHARSVVACTVVIVVVDAIVAFTIAAAATPTVGASAAIVTAAVTASVIIASGVIIERTLGARSTRSVNGYRSRGDCECDSNCKHDCCPHFSHISLLPKP
jgi:hypothetical protein